jgi:hypothetical protein
MGWFLRFDRFGDSHLVFSQEQGMSCGLACCKMVVFKMNKLRPGKDALTTEKQIETIYRKHDNCDVGKDGSLEGPLTKTLNELGAGNWAYQPASPAQIPGLLVKYIKADTIGAGPLVNSITRGYPVILGVCWKKGGHFVVVDTISKFPLADTHYASICDPGDGNVHIQSFDLKSAFSYTPSKVKYSFNAWGEPEQGEYGDKPRVGTPDGVIYCQKAPGFWS